MPDPLANPGFVFQLDENDTVWSAAAKNLPGNAVGAWFLAERWKVAHAYLAKASVHAAQPVAQDQKRAAQEVSEARTWAEENGIQQETPDGKTEFVPEEPEGNLLDRYDAQRTEKVSGIPTDPMVPAVPSQKASCLTRPTAVDPRILSRKPHCCAAGSLDDGQLKRLDEGEGVVEELDVELMSH